MLHPSHARLDRPMHGSEKEVRQVKRRRSRTLSPTLVFPTTAGQVKFKRSGAGYLSDACAVHLFNRMLARETVEDKKCGGRRG